MSVTGRSTSLLYAFFWVIPRSLNFICWRFGKLCLYHFYRQVGVRLLAFEDEETECSETSAYKIQTPGNYPEESMQHTEHGESLKSSTSLFTPFWPLPVAHDFSHKTSNCLCISQHQETERGLQVSDINSIVRVIECRNIILWLYMNMCIYYIWSTHLTLLYAHTAVHIQHIVICNSFTVKITTVWCLFVRLYILVSRVA